MDQSDIQQLAVWKSVGEKRFINYLNMFCYYELIIIKVHHNTYK